MTVCVLIIVLTRFLLHLILYFIFVVWSPVLMDIVLFWPRLPLWQMNTGTLDCNVPVKAELNIKSAMRLITLFFRMNGNSFNMPY